MGLSCSPICTRCGAEEETSIHVFFECDALTFHSDAYVGSFFLDPEDVKSIGLGPSETLVKEQGSLNLTSD